MFAPENILAGLGYIPTTLGSVHNKPNLGFSFFKRPVKFDWDEYGAPGSNFYKMLNSGRGFIKSEIESVFYDKKLKVGLANKVNGQLRYYIIGLGSKGIVRTLIFVIQNGRVRVLSGWATQWPEKKLYYEKI